MTDHLMGTLAIGGLLLLTLSARADAAVSLYGFETDVDAVAWNLRTPSTDTLSRSDGYATEGRCSLRFTTPKWAEGMEQWPAFEAKLAVKDWRGFDRLVIDITNPSDTSPFLRMLLTDSELPLREAFSFGFDVPQRGYKRFEVPLSSIPPNIDRSDISLLHIFGERPAADVVLHIDSLMLLKPGEQAPEPTAAFVRQLAKLTVGNLDELEASVTRLRESLSGSATTDVQRRQVQSRTQAASRVVEEARRGLGSERLTLAELDRTRAELERLPGTLSRIEEIARFEQAFDALGMQRSNMLVGFASSMEKIPPRDMPFAAKTSPDVHLSLARNEKESFQVLVTPRAGAAKGVSVSVGDLKSPSGAVFPAADIRCDVVGYVETKTRPPYDVDYVGWWPDPILDFLGPVDIAEGDLQAFWIRVRANKEQPPGTYRGTLKVSADGCDPLELPLTVQVRSFTLPDCTPLPTAITFFEPIAQVGGPEAWQRLKLQYADFLADYYIDYDSLYRQGPPDFEILKHLHDQGRLVAFNLGNVLNGGVDEAGLDAAMRGIIEQIRPGYEKAKELGILDHAYIYGFDERGEDQFPMLERAAAALRKAFPDVILMTTSYDPSYGMASVVKSIDAWCPLTPSFDPEKAEKARAQGKYVWWYICCGPHHPYANWFVEYPAIDARLLHGAMTAKQRPDGFLYYALTIWNDNKPIESGPFTQWNPVSWTVYHGDGSLFHCGPGGKPVPSIRLENYRDGMEDYAYACILEETIRRVEAITGLDRNRAKWLAEAKAALAVPESLVKTMTEFSRDPARLYAWRDRIADLIDRSDITDADPWGSDFGVRGFRGK